MKAQSRVLLLGIDTPIGLAIVRELAQHGVEVHGIAHDRAALGLYSRYLTQAHFRKSSREGVARQVVALAHALKPCHVMAISEGDIALLNNHRSLFGEIRLLIPTAENMAWVLDKTKTYVMAEPLGIQVPKSFKLRSMDDWDTIMPRLYFPVVLKWRDPNAVAAKLSAAGLKLEKMIYCHNPADLHAVLTPYIAIGEFPLVQEYCPGYGLGQFVFMHKGNALLTFQHRRVSEWPPEGGFSSTCEAVPLTEHRVLMEKSIALLRSIGWEGVGMVEYRFDPLTGQAALMEINGRFWGSLPLAYHCGAAFGWLTYAVHGNDEHPGIPKSRDDLRCRFMIPETKRLLRILFQPHLIQDRSLHFGRWRELGRFILEFLRPGVRYYVFSFRDPMPFFVDIALSLVSRVRSVVRRQL
ncbi:Predicted ATP-dependent carboligase, ATP-grasp superfamily [Nitrosospira sp. Nsp18]|uniref:carboxylate--amine ligase n=1 Tax=Nitrosospira sp. Nsp18 TaxID=1855334 RepID=UPI00088AE3B0|nr:hypothetical protein [Nitrosospira sp. Nsp18]SDA18617.1 Predicted ATP-dependent carboligase, ATP-grasp superfamily [Nitrosospira sp. Nsp18]